MSIPNPVNVSPSTTVVEVNPLQNPYTPVLLNAVLYPGQVVTILDATSSFGAVTTPIVISTSATNSFLDGSISTLINQPQGFVTAQSYNTNKWAFLNSFPFRNQNVSAGLLNLTTSTVYSQVGNTLIEYVSSLEVQNLFVTGNFVQSQGIQLNTNVSSLGTVELLSSLNVWGNTYLSSSLVSLGPVSLYSSLVVENNFSTSALTTASTMYISGSIVSLGPLSTPLIQVEDELKGTRLEVQTSTLISSRIAGSLSNATMIQVLSSFYMGGSISANSVSVYGNAALLSSASFFQNAVILGNLSTLQDVSIQGRLGFGGPLSIGSELQVTDSIHVGDSMTIGDSLKIGDALITSSLFANTLESLGDYQNLSTIAQISSIFAEDSVGAGFVSSLSLVIGGYVSSYGDFVVGKDLTLNGNLFIVGGISTLSSVSLTQSLEGLGSLSSLTNFTGSTLSTTANLTVNFSSILNTETTSTFISGNLMALGNLFCDGTLNISSITLPSSLLANTISTGLLFVGTKGITSNFLIPELVTSSVTIGLIQNSEYSFDLSGSILLNSNYVSPSGSVPLTLSVLSTALYSVGKKTNFYLPPVTYIYADGMGVGIEGVSTLEVLPLGYLTSTLTIRKEISSGTISTPSIFGTYIGNGSGISNINYPAELSALRLLVSAENIYPFNYSYDAFSPENQQWRNDGAIYLGTELPLLNASTLYTSSLLVENSKLIMQSSMTIGSLVVSGNGVAELNTGQNSIQTNTQDLFVNDAVFTRANNNRRVLINEDIGNISFSSNANLGVWATLAANSIEGAYEFNLEGFKASRVLASNVIGTNGNYQSGSPISPPFVGRVPPFVGGIYVSTGILSTLTGKFFIGESDVYDSRFNIVQPYRSTLQFNSTLFVNREFSSVGINTQPNFNLDVGTVYNQYTTTGGLSSIITSKVNLQPSLSTIFYAFGQSNATNSNTLYSGNANNWSNFFIPAYASVYNFRSLFSPGLSLTSNQSAFGTYTLWEQNLEKWFLGSATINLNPFGQIVRMVELTDLTYFPFSYSFDYNPPNIIYSMATNGADYFATGLILPAFQGQLFFTIFRLNAELGIFSAVLNSNIFPPFNSPTSYNVGGYSILYGGVNAPIWIVVGVGRDGPIYRSLDNGITWNVNNIGNLELRSIITTPLPENGGTVFLTGGSYLTPSGTTFTLTDGYVYASTDLGTNWSLTGNAFSGPVVSLATDGKKVVAAVNPTTPYYTLWYSYLTSSNTYNWQLCQGNVFATRANSVVFSGSLWVAAGDSGFRNSYDGITWFNPGTYTNEVLNVSYTSNAATSINMTYGESTIVLFQESPSLDCQRLISVPTISYYPSSILNLNNACILDEKKNFIIPGAVNTVSPLSDTNFRSTFYTNMAFVSSLVSTNQIQIGAYRAGIQYIV